jgi:hypothetical protein
MNTRALAVLPLALWALGAAQDNPQENSPAAPAQQPSLERWFRFESSMWVNLHHLLMQQAKAAIEPERGGPRQEPVDTSAWSDAERGGWERALVHYREHLASRDLLFDSGMVAIRDELARTPPEEDPAAGDAIDGPTAEALAAAAPAYRERLWPAHDARNREFADSLERTALPHAETLQRQVCEVFAATWPQEPILVDLSVDAGWAGAYTTDDPPHIVLSSTDRRHEGDLVVEILFHEASHVLVEKVFLGIRRECERLGKEPPRDLWHAALFFTVGELVRARAGEGYVPYAERFGLSERGPWKHYYDSLRKVWLPYVQGSKRGQAELDQAIAELVTLL